MSILDGDKAPWNLRFPTLGGIVFWEDLERRGKYTLQRCILDGHCRILNKKNIRVAWGTEGQMRAKLDKLTLAPEDRRAQYGDVIGVHRKNGLYDHYGVYESDSCVYEYAATSGDFGGEIEIHRTTLKRFVKDSGSYFVLTFPERHGLPGKMSVKAPSLASVSVASGISMAQGTAGSVLEFLSEMCTSDEYHLYSPEETIERAKSRLGERAYDLAKNNCEHYAIWCKTGMQESHQVDAVLKAIHFGLFVGAIPKILRDVAMD